MLASYEPYAAAFKVVFSDSERFDLFKLVEPSPRSVGELASLRGLSEAAARRHLATLESVGIVSADDSSQPVGYRLNLDFVRRVLSDLAELPDDRRDLSGQPAPPFRLPEADGRQIALAEALNHGPAIVWFSRGLTCSFCRRHRAQLALGYSAIRRLGAEIFEITPTPVEQAAIYFANYKLVFPYLCDPANETAAAYGVRAGIANPLRAGREFFAGKLAQNIGVGDWVPGLEATAESQANSHTDDGLFLVDQAGIIRFGQVGTLIGVLSNAEIERRLRQIA